MGINLINSNVVLVTSDEKSISYKWEDNSEKIKAIDVISGEYGWDNNVFEEFEFIGLIPNTEQVFLKSPFEKKKYIEIGKSEEYFFTKKISLYKNIAFLLGAKDFSANAEFIEEKRITTDANLNVSYLPAGELSGDYKNETESKIASEYDLTENFEDKDDYNTLDKERAYNEAKEIIENNNLRNEIDLTDFVEFRNPKHQKQLKSKTLKLKLTSELNTLIELSAKINVLDNVFGLEAGFKTRTEILKTIILRTEVNF
jgi:hypothetical protein